MAGEIVHRKKNFGGVETAQQVHAELAWYGLKCSACGGPPALKVTVWLYVSDMSAELRHSVAIQIALGRIRPANGPRGDAVCWGTRVACSRCSHALEVAAAKSPPSYAYVVLDRGPGPDSPIVGVVASVS